MQKIRAAFRFLSVFPYTVCCLFIIAFVFPFAGGETKGRIIRSWSHRLLRWLGCRVQIEGAYEADPRVADCGITPGRTGRLVACNHISFLDVFALNSALPSGFVAKAEIARWPVFGSIAKAVGTIFIERGNKRALLAIGSNMQAGLKAGRTLLMFPEGTTSNGLGLLRLHANLFDAAVKTGAEVLPVVLRYESEGKETDRVAYVGRTGLFECLWKVVNMPDLTIRVCIQKPFVGEDRRAICAQVSAVMSGVIGVADPLAAAGAA